MLLGSPEYFQFRTGKTFLLGDGSVRFVAPSLYHVVADIAANSRLGSIGEVVLGPADGSGWKPVAQPDGIIAILIGLLLPAVQQLKGAQGAQQAMLLPAVQKVREAAARMKGGVGKLGAAAAPAKQGELLGGAEQHALTLLRPYLAPGATLSLLRIHPGGVNAEQLGFTGGVKLLG